MYCTDVNVYPKGLIVLAGISPPYCKRFIYTVSMAMWLNAEQQELATIIEPLRDQWMKPSWAGNWQTLVVSLTGWSHSERVGWSSTEHRRMEAQNEISEPIGCAISDRPWAELHVTCSTHDAQPTLAGSNDASIFTSFYGVLFVDVILYTPSTKEVGC